MVKKGRDVLKKLWVVLLTAIFMVAGVGTALSEPNTDTIKSWEGTLTRSPNTFYNAILEINPDTIDSFKFKIQAYSGALS